MRNVPRVIASVALLLLASSASAQWPAGGTLISSPGDLNGVRNALILDLPSGDLAAIGFGNGGNSNYPCLQRVRRAGGIAPGWPADGVKFTPVIKGMQLEAQSYVIDESGDLWHVWSWTNTAAQFIDSSGAGHGINSPFVVAGSSASGTAHAAAAPDGDLFVASGASNGTRLRRITRAGVTAAGWPAAGVALPGAFNSDADLQPDGAGGVVVFINGDVFNLPCAMRIDGNHAFHPGWPAGGLVLGDALPSVFELGSTCQLLPSGADHFLAVWSSDVGNGMRSLRAQRFGLDGTLDPAWSPEGSLLVEADTLLALTLVSDGSGGVYVLRQSHGRPVVTHQTAGGGLAGDVDVVYTDVGAQYIFPGTTGLPAVGPDAMIADHTPDGGLIVGWNDARLAPAHTFRLRWLLPDLTPDPSKPDTGVVVFPGSPHPDFTTMLAVHSDGAGGAFVAWGDYHETVGSQVSGDLWMTRMSAPPVLGVAPSTPHPTRLALSAPRPNPARGSVAFDVTLPDDSPARVELLDVAGRIVRRQAVQGAGPHTLAFNELATIPAGLYFARVAGLAGRRTTRIVVSR